ncbi:AAA family ATPase [Sorangium sp. So ce341]|uniref:AAA family ATPase n=1 Tax=Sorangium sp. So ce341 TaxID=3133302 RepID=UPI003F5E0955
MNVILQRLTLAAYRGIAGLMLDELSPVSLIVGANNAGKSSILEAAGIVLRPPDPVQWASAVRQRDIDMPLVDGLVGIFPDSARSDSAGDGSADGSGAGAGARYVDGSGFGGSTEELRAPLRLSAMLGGHARSVLARASASTQLTDDGTEVAGVRVEVEVDGAPPIVIKFPGTSVPHQVSLYRVFGVTPGTHYSTKGLVEHLSRVIDEGKKRFAIDVLQMFDADVQDLDVIALLGREAVRVTHARRGVVDLSSFGDGMRRAVAMALALTRASQGVLLIDELEAGIHHSVLRPVLGKLLEAAATAHVQIVATTHSLEAVDAVIAAVVDREGTDSLAAYWVQRKDGHHEVRRYDFERLRELREGGLDIR